MPPGVFPFDHGMTEEEIATNQIKMLEAGIVGQPGLVEPQSSPELQRLFFDIVARSADPGAANGSGPLVYQWRFSDADPWHMVVDNGSTRAEPGEAPKPTVTFETSWEDWVYATKPGNSPVRSMHARQDPPPRQGPRADADAAAFSPASDNSAPIAPQHRPV